MAVATKKASKGSKKTTKSAKAAKVVKATTKTKAAKVEKVHAGGGIMVDVVSKPQPKGKSNGLFTNPYREGSSYFCVVEGLRNLGMNAMHPQAEVIAAVKKGMGDAWKAFAAKDSRNEATGKDAEGRVWQNAAVVARKDYGEPLRKIGFEVRFDGREKKAGLFKL
jgi:hypothetical protein